MTEIVGSKFYFGRKENLIRLQQFIEDEENCYLKLDKICLIKVPEEDFLHVWICGAGDAGAIDYGYILGHGQRLVITAKTVYTDMDSRLYNIYTYTTV